MNEQNRIKEFVIKFFENLGSRVSQEEKITVTNVPEKFQKFYGKTEPYYFFFDEKLKIPDAEYISRGSFLLSSMNKFLEDKGKTTLFRIEFPFEIKDKIEKIFTYKNCSVQNVLTRTSYNYLTRFTFLTTFQYINEKEQMINKILIKDSKICKLNLENYNLQPGNKRHVKLESFEKDYNKAKEQLIGLLANRKYKIGQKLSKKLSKELSRIEKHKNNQIKEAENNLKEAQRQVKQLNEKIENIDSKNSEEKDKIKWTKDKIQKIKEQIKYLESGEEEKRIDAETKIAKKEETQKHSLDIKNKLMNSSIIYYPIYENRILLKGPHNSKKSLDVTYNPLTEEKSSIKCDSCENPLEEIIICSSGHLTCRSCGDRCESCNEVICKNCKITECEECGKKICKNCTVKCSICNKNKCKKHIIEDKFSGQEICQKCIGRCSNCGDFIHPEYLKTDKDSGKDVCEKCLHKAIKSKTLKNIFKK